MKMTMTRWIWTSGSIPPTRTPKHQSNDERWRKFVAYAKQIVSKKKESEPFFWPRLNGRKMGMRTGSRLRVVRTTGVVGLEGRGRESGMGTCMGEAMRRERTEVAVRRRSKTRMKRSRT
jgi:hypothetical protein